VRNALMLALVGCTAFGRVYAQQRDRAAARDAPAAITGHVVSDGTPPQPLRRVIVTLGGPPQGDRRTVTDDDGTFGFPGLAPGRYTVTAAKAAFLTTAYGATAPGGLGTTLAVATGAHLDVTLTMARGAVIEGTILDQTGQPVPYVSVGALVSRDGAPLKAPAFSFGIGSFGTDDRGMYRIFGLPPGDYVVRATRPMLAATGAVDRPSAQDVTATLGLLSRGRQAAATQRAGGGEAAEDRFRHVTYAPVYYPGVNMEEEAVTIALHAGEERRGVDFTLNPAATAFVRGRISGAARDLGSAQVMLESRGEARAAVGRRGAVSHDGSFTFEDVVPGHYRVLARADPNAVAVPASSGPRRLSVATPESDAARTANIEYLWASTDVDVLGQDLDGLQLTLQPGARLDGHVRPDGAGSIAPELLTGVQLSLVPTRMSGPSMVVVGLGFTMVRTAAVGADGTFSFVGIGPGQYTVKVTLPAALQASGWWPRSAEIAGADALDRPMDVAVAAPAADMAVTLSNRHAAVQGVLRAAAGQPVSEYFILAFSTDSRLWQALSRRTQVVRPSSDGRFRIDNLPPGEYYVAAVTSIDPNAVMTPAFFEQAVPGAVRIAVADGETRTQDLRLAQ
jgi:protocatechuate 3,4-dioxygenase beta subunit